MSASRDALHAGNWLFGPVSSGNPAIRAREGVRTGGFASPSFDGFALVRRQQCAVRIQLNISDGPASLRGRCRQAC